MMEPPPAPRAVEPEEGAEDAPPWRAAEFAEDHGPGAVHPRRVHGFASKNARAKPAGVTASTGREFSCDVCQVDAVARPNGRGRFMGTAKLPQMQVGLCPGSPYSQWQNSNRAGPR